jgi:hypothetical protein
MTIKEIKNLLFGTIDVLEPISIPRGASSNSLNWKTLGDRIALRQGYKIFGNEVSGSGKITGSYTATKSDGTEIQYKTHGKKLMYYVPATDTWTEIGSDVLGTEANGKEMSFAEYRPLAGDYLYINSPYGPFLKIDLATPGTATDVYNGSKNYYGYIKIKQNRMFLWQKTTDKATIDPSGVYLSKIDDVEDFTYSATRVAGEGAIFRQDDGGIILNIESYGDSEYCLHKKKTWVLTLSADDTNATNLIYRENVGIPAMGASVATGDGIYLIDNNDENDPQVKLLTLNYSSDKILPYPVSKGRKWQNIDVGIDLSDYYFDKTIGREVGDYVLFACRTKISAQNNRVIVYNKRQKTFDIYNYWCSTFNIYDGELMAGDPVSNNIQQLLTDWDDDGSNIENYWEGNKDNLDWFGEKRFKKLIIRGKISKDQSFKVYAALDEDDYIELGTISGDSSAVVSADEVVIGRTAIGRNEIGGGGSGDTANEFVSEINVASLLGRFNFITLKFVAQELGECEISGWSYFDVRNKSHKIIEAYRSN